VLKCGKHTLRIDMAFPDGSARRIKAASEVEITGVCDLEFENSFGDTLFPHFRGFAILPRTAADVKVLAEPPWWTPFRLVCVIALLALALLATLAWNRSLAVISERKGRELYHEQIASAKAELKVEERTRLAVEIHDSLSQTLTGVSLQIDAAMRNEEKGFSAAERYLKTARQMLASCRHELRCCIWDLKSRTFEEKNMTEAVERMLAPHAEQTRISVRFNVPRTALSDSTTHAVLRIIRELTVNAVRHGKASNVRIAGVFVDGVVRFSVADDGAGFDPKSADGPAQGHFGLNGIRERLNKFNGKMEIASAPGKGTKATVTIKP
jgi:signal transduction histidine kinase